MPNAFSIRDAKIAELLTDTGATGPTYATALDFAGVQELSIAPDTGTQVDLRGDDTVIESIAQEGAMRFTLRGGGIPLDAISLIFDAVLTIAGTPPDTTTTFYERQNANKPYFRVRGLAVVPGQGEVVIELPKCLANGPIPPIGLVDGAFTTTEITGTALWTTATYGGSPDLPRRVILLHRQGTAATGSAA